MIVQKSNLSSTPTLYLVPTSIGNFEDMTYRSVKVLNDVDVIYCEDTRVTKVLLSHFDIKTPLKNYHIYNEDIRVEEMIEEMMNGKILALVSDAGLPCISDPGYKIASEVIKKGFNVVSLPGASASLTALIASGLPCEKFFFNGFLSSKKTQRIKQLQELRDKEETIIIYEAPHRIKETLKDMLETFGNRRVSIARELTKKYEEYTRGFLDEIVNSTLEEKGEMVIIVEGTSIKKNIDDLNHLTIEEHISYYTNLGYSLNEAMKKVANDRNVSKSVIYKQVKC